MVRIFVPLFFLLAHLAVFAQQKPQLVLVISVDQFRYDYLTRFGDQFGARGFNLFFNHGASFVNAQFDHSGTTTGPGHAVILSGSHPAVNGIIANDWFDVQRNQTVYCVEDEGVQILGVQGEEGRSPKNFIGMTVGDVLKLSNAGQAKVIAVSLKDRAAILLGGKLADAAYWLVDSSFVSSTYYFDKLPKWVQKFNAARKVNSNFGKVWDRLLPASAYARQGADDAPGEEADDGMGTTFPHRINGGQKKITEEFFEAFRKSPFSSEVLADFAKEAVVAEKLGQRGVTDLLCISFSANDVVGHDFGPGSHEVMDLTIRTDRILENFFNFIDQKVGLANCTMVLTSDHGVADLPERIKKQNSKIAAVYRVSDDSLMAFAEKVLQQKWSAPQNGQPWILAEEGSNLYLNQSLFAEKGIERTIAEQILKNALGHLPYIHRVYTRTELERGQVQDEIGRKALNSFSPTRSGDIFYQLRPYSIEKEPTGTTHGSPWAYDTHVPMLWYGAAIQPGKYYGAVSIVDIAPTLAVILGVDFPGGLQGRVLENLLKK